MADLLLRKGADLELGGLSPLIEAAQEGHLYLVKYLLNIGLHLEFLHFYYIPSFMHSFIKIIG